MKKLRISCDDYLDFYTIDELIKLCREHYGNLHIADFMADLLYKEQNRFKTYSRRMYRRSLRDK